VTGTADRLIGLAREVTRLGPDRRDPERFHLEKATIVAELRVLARETGKVPLPPARIQAI
jgi:hypothetical protein